MIPPQIIRQQMPAFPGGVTLQKTGVFEVVIDDNGKVESAMMRVPVNAQDTRMTTQQPRRGDQPTTVDGAPVRFVKRINVPAYQISRSQVHSCNSLTRNAAHVR